MYLALYRKWRPKTFSDVISQEHITSTLKNEIQTNKIAHSYLFTGSRGTGKTTCAKILAKAINCLNPIDGEPCCKCEICKGLDDASILDVTEMDGASNNSVNDIRLLRDEANFTPVSCKYRVYIIDEVHMLSISAFNALLKIMEEPPKHVIFILATTEVHKIPTTILSRCQRFDFKRIKITDIKDRLIHISSNEKFNITTDAAYKIANLSDGAMRDAISMLDQCASTTDNITIETVCDLLGTLDKNYILELNEAIKNKNVSKGVITVNKLYQDSKDMQRLCYELIQFYREAMLFTVLDDVPEIISDSNEFAENMMDVIKDITLSNIIEILETLENCLNKMTNSLNKRLQMELCIIKLCSNINFDVLQNVTKKNITNKENSKIKPINTETNVNNNYQSSKKLKSLPTVNNNQEFNKNLKKSKPITPPKTDLEPLRNWNDVLNDIENKYNDKMLSGFLAGSTAYVLNDKLYITFKNSIVKDKILEKKDFIANVIKEISGNNYHIFFEKITNNISPQNPLDAFLTLAEKSGIEVNKE